MRPDALEMRIETGGRGLDLHPSTPPSKRALDQGRLGVFLMQCLVDDVEARRGEQGKAEVRLVKRRQQRLRVLTGSKFDFKQAGPGARLLHVRSDACW